jgi:hypothetical protein
VVRLQHLKEWQWRKANVRSDLARHWDYFDYWATWWHPLSPVFHLRRAERMTPSYAFFSLRPWHERYNPSPKVAKPLADVKKPCARPLIWTGTNGQWYAKPWECLDHRMRTVTGYRNGFGDSISHKEMKPAVRWIGRSSPARRRRKKKVPGYKLHDSAANVMADLGCSRATAFRKIKAGFRIPTAHSTA